MDVRMFTVGPVAENSYLFRPDGSDLLRLTTNRATDGHAVWTADGRIMWSSGVYGFRGEVFAALYGVEGEELWEPFVCRPEELAQALERVMTDGSLGLELGARGRDKVLREFNADTSAAQLHTLFAEQLAGGGSQLTAAANNGA